MDNVPTQKDVLRWARNNPSVSAIVTAWQEGVFATWEQAMNAAVCLLAEICQKYSRESANSKWLEPPPPIIFETEPSFPAHKCGLSLLHNPNRGVYQTVAEWLNQNEHYDWRDAASRARAIQTNELWALKWYPETPVTFRAVAAPTFEELLTWADE